LRARQAPRRPSLLTRRARRRFRAWP
jgi:hypothetical protein